MINDILGMYLLVTTTSIVITYFLALYEKPKQFEKTKEKLRAWYNILDKFSVIVIFLLLFYIIAYDKILSYLTIVLILLSLEYLFFIYPYSKYLEE